VYNKLFSKIVDSSIWMEPDHVRLLWMMFIAIMDEDGFVNLASVKNVAHRAVMTLEKASEAIQVLESPDYDSSNPANEGRRLTRVPGGWIVNNSKEYRDIVKREHQKELNRERVRRHRVKTGASSECNDDVMVANDFVTPSDTDTKAETNKRKKKKSVDVKHDHTPEFEEFWQAYPRKLAKGNARKAWDAAVKKADPDSIIVGAIHYAKNVTDPKFTMHPATWLNAERWLDEEMQARKKPRLPDFDTPEGMAELERLFLENLHT
jgi:hypothetical protein